MAVSFLLFPVWADAQHLTQITGIVRDSVTNEPVPHASVTLTVAGVGTQANDNGAFVLSTHSQFGRMRVSAVGYVTREFDVPHGRGSVQVISLAPAPYTLGEVVVKRGKEKYSKKNNPAVDFVKRLIDNRDKGNPQEEPYYSFRTYERMLYGLNDVSEEDKNIFIRKFPFLMEFTDTSDITGKAVLPVSVREKVAWNYYRRSPKTHREWVEGTVANGIDEWLDGASVKTYLDDMFREVDIYGNDVALLSNRFVSPLSSLGPNFYKYYLNDTLEVGGERCVELSFVPFTSETFGFTGRLYVPLSGDTLFVKRVSMSVPRNINLNYVERLHIEQDYGRGAGGTRLKLRDDMEVELKMMPGTPRLFARRENVYSAHDFSIPQREGVFDLPNEVTADAQAEYRDSLYWVDNRPHAVRVDGNRMQQMLKRLRASKFYYWAEKGLQLMVTGYVPIGKPSKWDFGPLNTIISGNTLEGVRLRVGGMTTVNLSRHWFSRHYVAYGTRDKRFKYMAQLEYSFNAKKQLDVEFPIHSLRLKHQYDVDRLGQNYLYTNSDNVFLALKRKKDNLIAYLRTTELEYKREWANHFSLAVNWRHQVHEASVYTPFVTSTGEEFARYTQAGFSVVLRYAPGEKFYQSRSHRIPINKDALVVTLKHTWMPRGFMGSRYTVNKTELGLQKRFWFSAYGYTDVIIKAAKLWSKAAYPDLLIPNANLSYTIQNESYVLMNPMEFANDQYLSWDLTYWGNGVLFNRIPLLKKLKLREVVTMRGLWGSLSDKNNPLLSDQVFLFPEITQCHPMTSTPYMELGVGIDNILTFLRLDYTWRLTYRHTPGAPNGGLRVAFHFTF